MSLLSRVSYAAATGILAATAVAGTAVAALPVATPTVQTALPPEITDALPPELVEGLPPELVGAPQTIGDGAEEIGDIVGDAPDAVGGLPGTPGDILPSVTPTVDPLPSGLPTDLLGPLPGVNLPDLLNPSPETNGGSPKTIQPGLRPQPTGNTPGGVLGGTGGTTTIDPKTSAATSARSLGSGVADDSMTFGERAVRLAGPMALPVAAAMLALAGVGIMARSRGSLGSLEDDKEALGGWTVIRL